MWVHAKTPPIDIRITGKGSRQVVNLIRRAYPAVQVAREDEVVDITGTDWYRNISSRLTPGKALKVYRDNAGLTLAELSAKAGIAVPHLSAMENGKRGIGKVTAVRLGKALGCDYRRFL